MIQDEGWIWKKLWSYCTGIDLLLLAVLIFSLPSRLSGEVGVKVFKDRR